MVLFSFACFICHCEERSDEAISINLFRLLRSDSIGARNDISNQNRIAPLISKAFNHVICVQSVT